jgi:hypothetical protein
MTGSCRFPVFKRGRREPHDLLDEPLATAEPAILKLAHLEPGVRTAQPTRFRVRFATEAEH